MKHRKILLVPILFIALLLTPQLFGQNPLIQVKNQLVAAVDTTALPILPYPVLEISRESNSTITLVHEAGSHRISDSEAALIRSKADSIFASVDPLLADTLYQSLSGLKGRELDNAEKRINLYLNQISIEQVKLNRQYKVLENDFSTLHVARKRWKLTKDQLVRSEVPAALFGRIDMNIKSIDSVGSILQSDMQKLLLLQDRILERNNNLLSLKSNIVAARQSLNESMFTRDMPGFFRDLSSFRDPALFPAHLQAIRKAFEADVQLYKSDYSGVLKFTIVLFIVLVSLLYWFKNNHSKIISTERVNLTEVQNKLVHSPVLVAIFAVGIITRLAYTEIPYTARVINVLVLLVPLIIMAIRFFGTGLRYLVFWVTVIFMLALAYELLYAPDILQRILMMFLSVFSLVIYLRLVFNLSTLRLIKNKNLYNLVRNTGIAAILLQCIALIANLIGAFSLAEFLTLVPIQVSFLALIIMIMIRFIDLIFYLILASKFMLKLNVISDFFETIHQKITRFVSLFFWLYFGVKVLQTLRVNEEFFAWGKKVFTTKKMIGEASLSLQSIVIFVFVIWLSLFLTKLVRYILEKDVFVRVQASKGTPVTIIMLVRIALITGGFFLAAAAAGMELTNLSIILGAFSVGIGFGLQNIFNNMVSGLILAFERPINVGDTVEVGTVVGTVQNIGLRASKVRSFDGAEMIVPNGMLISDILINWTLSDSDRRMDIRLGVAYGTDPRTVVQIMQEVAMQHELVRKDPAPRAFFIDFADSSLNFRMLAWVDLDNRLDVESDLKMALNEKLKEAGIEIPFPQRDLHIRSDDTRPATIQTTIPASKTIPGSSDK